VISVEPVFPGKEMLSPRVVEVIVSTSSPDESVRIVVLVSPDCVVFVLKVTLPLVKVSLLGGGWTGDGGGGMATPVRAATLVEPRVTPSALAKRTKIRFVAGSKGMVSFPAMKIPNVGVALALIGVVTLAPGAATHAP
jgi:hypothetical protein